MIRGVNKGTAMHRVCEIYSINPENTMAFGDHELDIPLIKEAGFGIAMGNAVEKLKAVADYVTLSNEEDGVAYAIKKFILDNMKWRMSWKGGNTKKVIFPALVQRGFTSYTLSVQT